mmetsp:Transcript_43693/g.76019  ORF Transcript_43693/g.76019 Transcript_43693/m.76019 type:complete len:433 (-) Transcript_43693:428-1726(-)
MPSIIDNEQFASVHLQFTPANITIASFLACVIHLLLLVETLNEVCVLSIHDAALELEGRGEVTRLLAEVHRQPGPLLHDLRVRSGLAVGGLDTSIDVLLEQRIGASGAVSGSRTADLLRDEERIRGELVRGLGITVHLNLQRHQHGQELALVSDHHAVGHGDEGRLDFVLNQHGRHILTTGRDDQLFDATGDLHEARGTHDVVVHVAVEHSHITTVQVALVVDGLGGLVRHVHVAHEDVAAAVAQLARGGHNDALSTLQRAAAGADLPALLSRHGVGAGALRLAEHLVHRDVQTGKVVQSVGRDRRGSGEAPLGLVETQSLLDVGQNNRVGRAVAARRATTVAVLRHAAVLCAETLGPLGKQQHHTGVAAADLHHLLLDLLPHTGHAEEESRTHLLHGDGEGALERIGLGEVGARTELHDREDVDDLRGDVG